MDKKTFLLEEQIKLGAKLVPFAGWLMPVSYTSIIEEHNAVRKNVGLFDVSHMGEVFVSGKDALCFLQKLVPQDVSKLAVNKAVYCQLTNKKGGVIDDLIIYKLEDKYLLIVNASRIDEDLNWMVRNSLGFDVNIVNDSHNYSLLAIQGPMASDLVDKLGIKKENQPSYFSIKRGEILNINVLAARTGYTGEDGFEILVKNAYSAFLWDKILEEGKEFNIMPIGLGARDTLRLEAALHLYGNDLNEDITPVEAGLSWSVAKNKTADYNGKEVIMGQINGNISKHKKLVGFEMLDKIPARHGYEIYFENRKIGVVTSGGPSPVLKKNIGLAYLDVNNETSLNTSIKTIDTIVQIMIRNKLYDAKIVKRPFVEKKCKKENV
ncbi:MAG: glycine cleavage system aminomethyltransferase GcvT [Candidatus Gastranaerophilales bacterium]|nr:glycine cleavage system aminomethyltransferase GcvT [Candidatus Gastranaerophilales bacterium]